MNSSASYAVALYELSLKEKSLEEVKLNLEVLSKALLEIEDGIKLFTYPSITKNNKKEILLKITSGFNKMFIDFLKVLIDNNSFELINSIDVEFNKLIDLNNDKLLVDVVSSSKLNVEARNEIIRVLEKKHAKKTIKINNIIEENLIGGFKIIINGECMDTSLHDRLNRLKSIL
ncbi:MAG: ATP synthase F1 subunit delta [Anaeroplasmataceae bacterium]